LASEELLHGKDGALHSCWSGSPKYTRHCERSEAIQEQIARESGLLRRPSGLLAMTLPILSDRNTH